MINDLSVTNIYNSTIGESIEFHCQVACGLNGLIVWFIGEYAISQVSLDLFYIVETSNTRWQNCNLQSNNASYTEKLVIIPLEAVTVPVYCASTVVCNKQSATGCAYDTCFSESAYINSKQP